MSVVSSGSSAPVKLRAFLATLGQSGIESSHDPPWFEPRVTSVVDEAIYSYFRRLGSPKAFGDGWFVVGRDLGPFRLFWRVGSTCFGRELTDGEVARFGELTGMSLVVWTRLKQSNPVIAHQGDIDDAQQ